MVKTEYIEKTVVIPEKASVKIEGKTVTVTGPKGAIKKDFSAAPVTLELHDKNIKIYKRDVTKKEAALIQTLASHIKNMFEGVVKGYTYKMKIVYSHFPISVKLLSGDKIQVENFGGERSMRTTRILKGTTVQVKGDDILIEGVDKDAVSQTAANIQQISRVKDKDPRVFMDGIYVYQKLVGEEVLWKLV